MDLRKRAKTLRAGLEESMGLLVSIQKKFTDRAAEGLNPQPAVGPNGGQPWPPLPPSMVAGGSIAPRQLQPHGLARPAAAMRQQAPMLHRMTASPAAPEVGGGSTQQAHSQATTSQATTLQAAPSQATSWQAKSLLAATRTQNPYQYTSAHYRVSGSNISQQQTQQYQMQPGFLQQQQQQFNGQPPQGYRFRFQAPPPYGYSNQWQNSSQNKGARHLVRFPAMMLPTQPQEVEAACTWAASCWPELPADRLQGIFSISQTGEILTVQGPRDGEDWMRLNQREEDQRWAVLNGTMAVLASAKTTNEKMMLEQFEALVQPMQVLEHLRKTMPMTEAQLDMVTTMHESMFFVVSMLWRCCTRGVSAPWMSLCHRTGCTGEEEGQRVSKSKASGLFRRRRR
jgi:hypothetical protein